MNVDIREIGMEDTEAWCANWEIRNTLLRLARGARGTSLDPLQIRDANRRIPPERLAHYWNASVDGQVVGRLRASARIMDDPVVGRVAIQVLPDFQRQGIGMALLGIAEEYLRSRGAVRFQVGIESGDGDAASAVAGRRFAARHGYRMYQRMVLRTLELPASLDLTVDAGYRVDVVTGDLTDAEVEDLVVLRKRMNTDAPHGDIDPVDEAWDADRVRHEFHPVEGLTFLRAYAHTTDGQLAGFSTVSHEVAADPELNGMLWQADTLVLREHRGHGLGRALKSHAIDTAQRHLPQLTWTRTMNAEENLPMIRINEELGYRIAGADELYVKEAAKRA